MLFILRRPVDKGRKGDAVFAVCIVACQLISADKEIESPLSVIDKSKLLAGERSRTRSPMVFNVSLCFSMVSVSVSAPSKDASSFLFKLKVSLSWKILSTESIKCFPGPTMLQPPHRIAGPTHAICRLCFRFQTVLLDFLRLQRSYPPTLAIQRENELAILH